MVFPLIIDTFLTRNPGDLIKSSSFNDIQNSITAVQTKLGVDNSSDTNSIDYKIGNYALF
jgi:hypothetical protein